MSFSTLFFLGACLGTYKLGSLNQRHPGRMWEWGKWAWKSIWNWMNQ